jgi:hypothetical protein
VFEGFDSSNDLRVTVPEILNLLVNCYGVLFERKH